MPAAAFIPLCTNQYKMAYCRALEKLPNDVKQEIWRTVLDIPPPQPKKPVKISKRLSDMMNRWSVRQKLTF